MDEITSRGSLPPKEDTNGTLDNVSSQLANGHAIDLKSIAKAAARTAEKRVIAKVLERTRWNRKEAAELLQISYKALLYKMKEAGLSDRR